MREEDWRDAYSLGLLTVGATAPNKRYKLSEILEVTDTYSANPGGAFGVGQFVFAMACCGVGTNGTMCGICVGMCVPGCDLIPTGICCTQPCGSTNCTCITCLACSFTLGTSSTTYVALGSMNGCGATVWRRIV